MSTLSLQVFSHHCPFLMGPIECLTDVVTPDTDIQVGAEWDRDEVAPPMSGLAVSAWHNTVGTSWRCGARDGVSWHGVALHGTACPSLVCPCPPRSP